MKRCARCKADKPESEFYSSKRFKDGLRTWCKGCDRNSANLWRQENRERALANLAAWKAANAAHDAAYRKQYYLQNRDQLIAKKIEYWRAHPEEHKRNSLRWKRANPEKNRAAARRWAAENRERAREKARAWAKANHGRVVANVRLREAREKRAMPKWANRFFIGEIYDLARLRSKMLGEPWHVDHIVPLISPLVCGLHVEHNLRVIPARINRAKSNSHWPDKP